MYFLRHKDLNENNIYNHNQLVMKKKLTLGCKFQQQALAEKIVLQHIVFQLHQHALLENPVKSIPKVYIWSVLIYKGKKLCKLQKNFRNLNRYTQEREDDFNTFFTFIHYLRCLTRVQFSIILQVKDKFYLKRKGEQVKRRI